MLDNFTEKAKENEAFQSYSHVMYINKKSLVLYNVKQGHQLRQERQNRG